ncbi:hypothetical protein IAG44_22395 [Streptomyces roseirectus]|uniref:Uncharacterized protein n=1 Tax=Streptomyces roseirectus TaxID=2768066 RepID=A0A7H0IGH3_9ACTN|nr:hypothetical protein [Streptomyces roseirectus]QNP71889.1 hypothetical protein IAG44_22395 [Streptomyces roseirectus]
MTLPRKGTRRIVVAGVSYRWHLRRRPTYARGLLWTPCTYVVEHADSPGAVLVVTTGRPHPGNWLGAEAVGVRPSDVAGAVERALDQGWAPTTPGAPFHLRMSQP